MAQTERRSDLLLSALRGTVKAMGGERRSVVEFPGRVPVTLSGLGDEGERR